MRHRHWLVLAILLLVSCIGEPTPLEERGGSEGIKPAVALPTANIISDGRTGGNADFYFLFPIVPERPPRDRPFDAGAAPTVTVCRLVNGACAETVADFPYSDKPGLGLKTTRTWAKFEFYLATWWTPANKSGQKYRVTVKAYGLELGFVDVQLVKKLTELRSVPNDVVGVLAGLPVPVPFRIEIATANPPTPEPCPACVFGPRVYVRGVGAPATEEVTFAGDPAVDYVIDINDGGSLGADGFVSLNGVTLLAPRTTNESHPTHLHRAVPLKQSNRIEVRLVGKPGSWVTVSVVGGAKVIGAGGGTVTAINGQAKVTVPAGAIPSDVEVQVIVNSTEAETTTTSAGLLGRRVTLLPEGLRFDTPVILEIMPPAFLAATDLSSAGIYYEDPTEQMLIWLPGGFNQSRNTVWAPIGHFSNYRVDYIPDSLVPRSQPYTYGLSSTFTTPRLPRANSGFPVSPSELLREFTRAVAEWSGHLQGADIRFAPAAPGTTPDIEVRYSPNVGAIMENTYGGGLYYGVIGYDLTSGRRAIFLNDEGVATSRPNHRVNLTWYTTDDILRRDLDRSFDGNSDLDRDVVLQSVLQHEFGHALGLRHWNSDRCDNSSQWVGGPPDECVESPVMGPIISGFYPVALRAEDLSLLRTKYGNRVDTRVASGLVAVTPQSPSGGSDQDVRPEPTVRVVDGNGLAVPGVTVLFDPIGSGSALNQVQLSEPGTGNAEVGSWRTGSGAGPWRLRAYFYDRVTGTTVPFIGSGSRQELVFTTTPDLPDLVLSSMSGPDVGVPGQPAQITLTDGNIGGRSVAAGWVGEIRLSSDQTCTASAADPVVLAYQGPQLAAGESRVSVRLGTIPESIIPGAYYWCAIAVSGNVNEVSTANNTAIGNQIAITAVPVGGQSTLLAYYPLDGNGSDQGALPHIDGNVTNATQVTGRVGTAMHFSGGASYIQVPIATGSKLALNSTDQFTISMWIRPDQLPTSTVDNAIPLSAGINLISWSIQVRSDGTPFVGACTPTAFCYSAFGPAGSITPGNWYHLVHVFDGSARTIQIYVNGVPSAPVATGFGSVTTDQFLHIGSLAHAPQHGFIGTIDEVRIYRGVLSPQEIQTLAGAGATPQIPSGLVAFYPLDGNGIDASSNGNNGTVSGATAAAGHNGQSGTALRFSGSSVVTVPSNPILRGLTGDMSLVFWVKRDVGPIGNTMIPVSRREPSDRIHFLAYAQPGGFGFQCCSPGGSATGMFYVPGGDGLSTISNGQWHQIGMVRRFGAGGFTRVYVDGSEVPGSYVAGSASDVAALLDAALLIGRQASESDGQFQGFLDNVYLFNRVLTPTELQALP